MKDIISLTRTYRRFKAEEKITLELLEDLVKLARLAGSARNCQPWQYMLINDQKTCDLIFPHLAWAAYLKDWKGPAPEERPSAYIICYLNREWLRGSDKEAHFDLGIASQNILLGATGLGLGGCRIGAFSPKLTQVFSVPDHLDLQLVIALGVPSERVVIEEAKGGKIEYWHDDEGVHHVPKRSLSSMLLPVKLA